MREDCGTANPAVRLGTISVNRCRIGVGEGMRQEAAPGFYRESRGLRQEGKIRAYRCRKRKGESSGRKDRGVFDMTAAAAEYKGALVLHLSKSKPKKWASSTTRNLKLCRKRERPGTADLHL